MSDVNIYVATDIRGVGKKKGTYIYLIEKPTDKGPATVHNLFSITATKDVAELTALVAAVSRLKQKPLDIDVYVSSEQLKLNIVHYLKPWAANNFCRADGKRLSCWQLWKELYEKTRFFNLRVYNKPHSYTNWLIKQCEQEKNSLARGS